MFSRVFNSFEGFLELFVGISRAVMLRCETPSKESPKPAIHPPKKTKINNVVWFLDVFEAAKHRNHLKQLASGILSPFSTEASPQEITIGKILKKNSLRLKETENLLNILAKKENH